MEENYQSWLSEELFNAYIRHVVEHIKRLKSSKKCTCPSSASESEWNLFATVKNKLANAAEAVDHCKYAHSYFHKNIMKRVYNCSN